MQKGFGLIGILIVVAIIAGLGAFVFTSVSPGKNPFAPSAEEKSAIDVAEQAKQMTEQKNLLLPNEEEKSAVKQVEEVGGVVEKKVARQFQSIFKMGKSYRL